MDARTALQRAGRHTPSTPSLDDLNSLTPELRKRLLRDLGLEVRISSKSYHLRELFDRAAVASMPRRSTYDRVSAPASPGYDRVYDRE